MKPFLIILALFSTPVFSQGKIEVVVTNIKALKGNIRVAIFNSERDFLEKAFEFKVVKVSANKVTLTFDGLSNGDYALSVFHDENGNNKLDKNFMGIPVEGFAFGNNSMGTFGPPLFEKAKVTINSNTVVQDLSLRHF